MCEMISCSVASDIVTRSYWVSTRCEAFDLRNGEVVVRSVVQGALVGLQRHQVDPAGV